MNLIQYSSSGAPVFIQRAAELAIKEGEPQIVEQLARARDNRQILLDAFARRTGSVSRARVGPSTSSLALMASRIPASLPSV